MMRNILKRMQNRFLVFEIWSILYWKFLVNWDLVIFANLIQKFKKKKSSQKFSLKKMFTNFFHFQRIFSNFDLVASNIEAKPNNLVFYGDIFVNFLRVSRTKSTITHKTAKLFFHTAHLLFQFGHSVNSEWPKKKFARNFK